VYTPHPDYWYTDIAVDKRLRKVVCPVVGQLS
jgi:hypothetical protein